MTNPTQPAEGMPELKPCPFCGGEAKLHPATRGYKASVECTVCETGNPCFVDIDYTRDSAREAAEEWNRRAAPKAPPMPDDVYGAMLSTIGAASMYLSREQMKPFIDWLAAQGFTKE